MKYINECANNDFQHSCVLFVTSPNVSAVNVGLICKEPLDTNELSREFTYI
jgi:hypothetical protein